jgi:pimeloyl-ACP methyl ester carboxylesterase
MTPFTIAIPDATIADLRARLAATRWPDEVEGAGWDYGMSLPWLQRFVAHWQAFDWRAAEARLNAFPQFTTEIDGKTVHFVHVRGKGANPTPLLLANGWPSNFAELLPLVPLLTEVLDGVSFDVVIPSLPGYGFSGKPRRKGMHLSKVTPLWAGLMQQLGYERYLTSGSDLGAGVLFGLTRHYPDRLIGVHFSNVYYGYPRPKDPTPEEQEYFKALDGWTFTEAAYAMEQSTKPTTLAVGLTDSPAGLAAWILEKFRTWGDTKGDIESVFSLDDLATIVSIYWYTGTIGSSVRLYKEVGGDAEMQSPLPKHNVPHGVTAPAGGDIPAPRAWGERNIQNLIYWNKAERGGHFPALETPDFFAGEIRAFHREIVAARR